MRRYLSLLALALPLALLPAATLPAQERTLSPEQRREIQELIRETFRAHPEIVLEAIRALQARQQEEEANRARTALKVERDTLHNDPDALVIGNPKGDVTVVEFFDYRCGYCKQVHPRVKELIRTDSKVRVVMKELPVLGPDSVLAARAALASRKQDKYPPFHDALMSARGRLDDAAVMQIAAEVGLDVKKLRADMADPAIERIINANLRLAERLGIGGTPAFVIGDNLVPGAIPLAQLQELVSEARAGCATC
ncbi:MAG: DsbA family protein [Alphaproteobacteria bacterium]|nr:DsbA family protein [Alphaproteobacteria bacterium]